jgi:hypothetical protein
MRNNLALLTSLSAAYKPSKEFYRYLIDSGVRWDLFRKTFERKKWFIEGAYIGKLFIEYAHMSTGPEYTREILLCYNFALGMLDKADLSDVFCITFDQGALDIEWGGYYSPLSISEKLFAKTHGLIKKGGISPLYIWIQRYIINKRKKISGNHLHLQNGDTLTAKLQGVQSLLNYLRDCT